jgi:hypothetical protein
MFAIQNFGTLYYLFNTLANFVAKKLAKLGRIAKNLEELGRISKN